MSATDYTLPPVPRAIAGGFLQPAIEAVEAYGYACAKAAQAPLLARIAELEQSVETLRFALPADKRALLQGSQEQAREIDRLRAELEAKDARIAELEAALVLPSGPWRQWWQGSGPERGDHIMSTVGRVAYLPAPDGTEGLHEQAGEIVSAHNIALSVAASEIDRLRAEVEAKDARIAELEAELAEAQSLSSDERTEMNAENSHLRAEVEAKRADAERLDWLLCRLPEDVLRDLVGYLSDMSDVAEFRRAIDRAAGFLPGRAAQRGEGEP